MFVALASSQAVGITALVDNFFAEVSSKKSVIFEISPSLDKVSIRVGTSFNNVLRHLSTCTFTAISSEVACLLALGLVKTSTSFLRTAGLVIITEFCPIFYALVLFGSSRGVQSWGGNMIISWRSSQFLS
jgi:hypothetical protein